MPMIFKEKLFSKAVLNIEVKYWVEVENDLNTKFVNLPCSE
tara:strand:- start:51690 stop:51812 length:123 start_codon:yes stop_codon:yes gene_type:complete